MKGFIWVKALELTIINKVSVIFENKHSGHLFQCHILQKNIRSLSFNTNNPISTYNFKSTRKEKYKETYIQQQKTKKRIILNSANFSVWMFSGTSQKASCLTKNVRKIRLLIKSLKKNTDSILGWKRWRVLEHRTGGPTLQPPT